MTSVAVQTFKTRRPRTRRDDLKDMLRKGLVQPGEKVLFVSTFGHTVYGDLHANATITEHGFQDTFYMSVSSFALTVIRRYNYSRKASCGYQNVWYTAHGAAPVMLAELRTGKLSYLYLMPYCLEAPRIKTARGHRSRNRFSSTGYSSDRNHSRRHGR